MSASWGDTPSGLPRWPVWLLVAAIASMVGCTPLHYRLRADRETYEILDEKTQQPRWWTPPISIEPPPESRNHNPYDLDRPPMPPDDSAAHTHMHCADGRPGYGGWHKDGDAPQVEPPCWLASLELTEDQELELDRDRSVELGLLNSREYQFELEDLYLSALFLTLERYEFDLQWNGGNTTFFRNVGRGFSARESNSLITRSNLGFTKAFTSGGQLLADFANEFVWEFSGNNTNATLSAITVSMVQPLLRGAFRDVRMESLTQAERDVLYTARDYARFRKQFYFDIASGNGGYLSLLLQLQGIRNSKANLISLDQNLRAHEALAAAGIVSPIQVDQVFQSQQARRLQLIRAENDLQNALDGFKMRLGLPPELEVHLDDSLLQPFELNSPEIARLQEETEDLLATFRKLDEAPPFDQLRAGFQQLGSLQQDVVAEADVVMEELQRWEAASGEEEPSDEQKDREQTSRQSLRTRLEELLPDAQTLGAEIERVLAELDNTPPQEAWEGIQRLAREQSRQAADLFVIQTQVRTYLIELPPHGWESQDAVSFALDNRLDLMNRQAQVVDAWRKIRVAADTLESDLDVFADAVIGTEPGGNNPVKFSSNHSSYRVGVRFDGPLNRKAERNIYRAELVEYERARRRFIANRDKVVRGVRQDLRELAADRLNFEIARQSLITAARQVELARVELLAPGQEGNDSSATQNVLDALDSLLDAKNGLIAVWIAYETDRLQLLLDTEWLQLDERGLNADDDTNFDTPTDDESNNFETLPPGSPDAESPDT